MNLEEALAAFPPTSAYRDILAGLLDQQEAVRKTTYRKLKSLNQQAHGQDPMATTWNYSEPEALALFNAAVGLQFPPPKSEWEDVVHDLIFPLIRSPHTSLVAPARESYPRLSQRARCAILSLLGACGTREAAEAFMACIREHGWPASVYDRVITELAKLLGHADTLFPELIELAGPNIGGVTDVLVAALAQENVDLASSKIDLELIAPFAVEQLTNALESAKRFQRNEGVAWRFAEDYWAVRRQAECWLDIAGYLKSPVLDSLLNQALERSDPRLIAFAAASLLRRGCEVAEPVLRRVAACHETCELLFELLRRLDKVALFPRAFRTRDAFAAANMVSWLIYPTELGREPDQIEKMAVFTSIKPEGELALYVWKFRNDDGPWYAGVSGPYRLDGDPGPLHGNLTFSRFDEWDSATAEQHAEAAVETLDEWRRAKI